MLRIVLDTNVLVSALGWRGNPRKILTMGIDGKLILVESPQLIDEFMAVLAGPKFSFISGKDKMEFCKSLVKISELVEPTIRLDVIKKDKNDNRVLECAIAGKADYIVSGDAHLLKLKKHSKVNIVNSKAMVDIIEKVLRCGKSE